MTKRTKYIANLTDLIIKQIRYNFKIIFGGKFFYFLLAAVGFFIMVSTISLFSNANPDEGDIYNLLIFPGILLVFYPTTFGIQNDDDSRMLEIIFGIPDYRYKVWLVRFALIHVMVFAILLVLGLLSSLALVSIPVFEIVSQLMFLVFFLGALGFMFSTVVKNGNGTAVTMIVIGLGLWILSGEISNSEWNVFFNPFHMPSDMNETIWEERIFSNRLYLICGGVIALLYGLMNLQNREKFI
jgi:hypothetical protein